MEFRESVSSKDWMCHTPTPNNNNNKQSKWRWRWRWKWRMIMSRPQQPMIPMEFICPISNSLMSQPVTVSSGHTFELASVQLCINLDFTPTLPDASLPDFSILIPNHALRSTIHNFCAASSLTPPQPHHHQAAVLALITAQTPTTSHHEYAAYTCSSENEIIAKLGSAHVYEVEDAVESLRKMSRCSEASSRVPLCTPQLLTALKCLVVSRQPRVQVHALATLVNLSLEKMNKVKIVRSGLVPPLIHILRANKSSSEAQEHACSAIFSLSLDDANKTAIGVLGALQPLLVHALTSAAAAIRNDSAWALYHLSMAQSNRVKLIKLGAVQNLLKHEHVTRPVIMLILCNMAACAEGRAAMLDAGAVAIFVSMLRVNEMNAVSCIDALYELSHGGGVRFKILAKEAGTLEVLRKLEEEELGSANEVVKYKARKVMEAVVDKWEEKEADVDWEQLIDSGLANHSSSSHF